MNPFIYNEADDDVNEEEDDNMTDNDDIDNNVENIEDENSCKTSKQEMRKLIDKYVKTLIQTSAGNKRNSVLVSLKELDRHVIGNLCFFMQLAYWHLVCKNGTANVENDQVNELGNKCYKQYKEEYTVTNDEMLNGVSIQLIPFLENTFKTGINVYEISSFVKDDKKSRNEDKQYTKMSQYGPLLTLLHSYDSSMDIYKAKYKT